MLLAESPRKRRVLKGVLPRVGITEGEMARDLVWLLILGYFGGDLWGGEQGG